MSHDKCTLCNRKTDNFRTFSLGEGFEMICGVCFDSLTKKTEELQKK